MSALNNAFIKAYAKGPETRSGQQPDATESSSAAAPSPWLTQSSWHRADQPHPSGSHRTAGSGPHLRFASSPAPQASPSDTGQGAPTERTTSPAAATASAHAQPSTRPAQQSTASEITWEETPTLVMPSLLEAPISCTVAEPPVVPMVTAAEAALPALTEEEMLSLQGLELPQPAGEPVMENKQPAVDEFEHSQDDERVAAAPERTKAEFTTVWELDRLVWPATCVRLHQAQIPDLLEAGEKLQSATSQGLHVLGITGAARASGCTTLALSLARCAAEAGLKVALVDANWDRPQLADQFGLQLSCGWQDAVEADLTLEEASLASLEDRLVLIPLTAPVFQADAATARRARQCIAELSTAFDLVIVDLGAMQSTPNLLLADDGSCPIDAAILVSDLRKTSPSELYDKAQQLRMLGVEAVGLAENFVVEDEALQKAA